MGWTSLLRDSSRSSAAMCVRNAAIRHIVARCASINGPVTATRNYHECIHHQRYGLRRLDVSNTSFLPSGMTIGSAVVLIPWR